MDCRHCAAPLDSAFLDLGTAPPSNAYLEPGDLARAEVFYPLKICVCGRCGLVQTHDIVDAGAMFNADYAYFSSVSASWLAHAAQYSAMIADRLALGPQSFVIEIAANDGYLLRNFVAAGIPCLGIEPTAGTARAARALGIEIEEKFFTADLGRALAAGRGADLVIGNNVYAHVPAINDFTQGMKAVLKPGGTITLEFPHLLRMIAGRQFDTVYHEHFSYLSLATAARIFAAAGLRVFDVEKIPTHGGSLRIYGCHSDDPRAETPAFHAAIAEEEAAGLGDPGTYRAFQTEAARIKNDFMAYLIEAQRRGQRVAGYGAAAKGNTLLNFAGVKADLLPCIYDAAASKQGRFTPGSRIPIIAPSRIAQDRPDIIVVFPWNIIGEVREQLAFAGAWGARLVIAVPQLKEEAL